MKNLLPVISIIVLAYLSHLIFPWWIIWLVCAVICYLFKCSVKRSIIVSFSASFILWFLMAFIKDQQNNGLLSSQIGELFGGISGFTLTIITGVLGGLIGTLGGMSGSLGRKIIHIS